MDLRLTSNAAAGPKNGNPRGWSLLGRLASWLLSHRARGLGSFVAPRHPPQQPPAHPMPIYEMGSSRRAKLLKLGNDRNEEQSVDLRAIDTVLCGIMTTSWLRQAGS